MSGICAFGPMASPQQQQEQEPPDATHFRVGDVWRSPVGTIYVVEKSGFRIVWLRLDGDNRLTKRGWDSIGAHSDRPWVRESWGGQS